MITDIDEAIKHCLEVAEYNERQARLWDSGDRAIKGSGIKHRRCLECAKEHRQLAEWLKELKFYKDRQELINKSWQELINYKEKIKKIKMRSQSYRERGETILASGMEQALDILEEVNADD